VTTQLLRERFEEVVACESYPESAAALGIAAQSAQSFCQAWLDACRPTPELILANPPRAGLGADVCAALLQLGAPRVQIMSCSAKTLAEDLRRLDARYRLVGLRGYDTLPQTNHVELVAWLVLR
jgi:tRNA/tmRNA/rRNA uracil-C5-methylase (TrmA/RlmC/RlmD family)